MNQYIKNPVVMVSLFGGSLLILSVFLFGFMGRSALLILPLGVIFGLLDFLNKKSQRPEVYKGLSRFKLATSLLITLLVQYTICSILFFFGRGIGSTFGKDMVNYVSMNDWYSIIILLVVSLIFLKIIAYLRMKNMPKEVSQNSANSSNSNGWQMVMSPEKITVDNFFTDEFYRRKNEIFEKVGTDELIEKTEQRLNIKLPPLLKELYKKQNGGMCRDLWVRSKENPTDNPDDWRGVFSHDYCYLLPLDKLLTQYESFENYMSSEELQPEDKIVSGIALKDAKRYIILCQRYLDTTFLDYSKGEEPRVGVVDFDGIDPSNVWFDSFDDFFKELRRGTIESI